jgi:hypothetical protein
MQQVPVGVNIAGIPLYFIHLYLTIIFFFESISRKKTSENRREPNACSETGQRRADG